MILINVFHVVYTTTKFRALMEDVLEKTGYGNIDNNSAKNRISYGTARAQCS